MMVSVIVFPKGSTGPDLFNEPQIQKSQKPKTACKKSAKNALSADFLNSHLLQKITVKSCLLVTV